LRPILDTEKDLNPPNTLANAPLNVKKLRSYQVPETFHRYTPAETALYALGVGAGLADFDETRYVYEEVIVALPTMALVLGTPGFWLMNEATGLDWPNILHGEQALRLHRPLRPTEDIVGRTEIGELADKGPDRPAILRCSRELVDRNSGAPIASLEEIWVIRGAGGFGGEDAPFFHPLPGMPEREPDAFLDLPTARNQAMLYRLTGDRNPLHIDQVIAARGGFDQPILHGLATMGVVGRALIRLCCDDDPSRLTAIRLRFTASVLPGDVVRTEVWRQGGIARFRARVLQREALVIDGGLAETAGFSALA